MSSTGNLSAEIAKALSEYSSELEDEIDTIAQELGDEAVATLKATSPKNKGKYGRGWRLKKNAKGSYVIHNATGYQLTHLLENGHVLRNGGRSRAIPHIQPVEEKLINSFERKVKEAIQK